MRKVLILSVLVLIISVPAVAKAQNVGYDGGFFVQNDEGTFKLKMTGRVQPKVEFTKQTVPTTAIPATKRTTFSMKRAELGFASTIHDDLTFRIGLKHATNSQNFNTVNVAYATASYEVIPEFIATAGMVGLPLSMMSEVSSKWFLLPEPPITELQDDGIQNFTIARLAFNVPDGLGLNFAGDISKFFYSVSVVNGAESNYAFNPNNKFSFGARFGVNILDPVPGSMTDFECSSKPKLTVSAGTMYQAQRIDPNTGADIGYMWTSSLGVGLRWGGFAFTTEGYYRWMKVNSPGTAAYWEPHLNDIGYYAAAGYYIIPKKFEIAAQAAQIFREGPDNNANSFGGGLNYYVFDNNFKLQLAYVWTMDYDDAWGASANNHIHNIALMASALF
jgi:hypothetical protein